MVSRLLIWLALLANAAGLSSPQSYRIRETPPGWGTLVTVGGSSYINFSTPGCEDLLHVMDLPRCLHEGASAKERNGWKLSTRDAKYLKRQTRRQARPLHKDLGSNRSKNTGGRMGFIQSLPILGNPLLPALCPFGRDAALVGESITTKPALPCRFGHTQLRAGGGLGFGKAGNTTAESKGFGSQEQGGDKGRGISGLRKQQMEKPEAFREVEMYFTCNKCETRQSKRFTRNAYEKGVVIVACQGCDAKHLIADHLGWYKDWTTGLGLNIEEMMKSKGIQIDNRMSPWVDVPVDIAMSPADAPPMLMRKAEDGTYEVLQDER